MWLVLQHKKNDINIIKRDLLIKFKENYNYFFLYKPKFKVFKKIKYITNNYFFLKIKQNYYQEKKNILLNKLKFTPGIKNILLNSEFNQEEINSFINHCFSYEDDQGFLKKEFFVFCNFKKIKLNFNKFLNYVIDVKNLINNKSIFYKNGKKIVLDNNKASIDYAI